MPIPDSFRGIGRFWNRSEGREGHPACTWREASLALLALCAVAAVLLHPQLARMRAVPDLGDPLFSIWRLGWVYQQVRGDERGLFDANIFHPEPLTLTYSDSMLLPATAAVPLQAAGLHPVVIYNILLIASFVVSGWAAFFLVRHLTGDWSTAVVAGLLFGFYPYRFEHYAHLELQMTMFMPWALLALSRFAETHGFRWLLVAAVLLVAQMYSSMYYGVYFALYASLIAVVWLFFCGRRRNVRLLPQIIVAAALSGALVAPLATAYLRSTEVRRGRDMAAVAHFSATPMDFLRAHSNSATWRNLTPPGRQVERQLFPGVTILLLALVGVLPPIGRVRLAFIAGLVFAFDASLGVNGFSYPLLYEWLPPVRSMRVPARFSILFGLSLTVLAGFGLKRLLERLPRGWGRALVALAVVGITVDVWPVFRLRDVWPAPPGFYAALAGRPGVVLAEFPSGGTFPETPYMYFSLWHWQPMINGYSGYEPESHSALRESLERFPDPATIAVLRSRGVTHVTVNCALFRDAGFESRCDRVLRAASSEPGLREVARTRWANATVVLFEMTDAPAPRPE